ncbi:hypothetical protein [Mycobacterium sp.]|uniref:hypothetical protein n=1 Tax=Mycobacterium sp. TaxID=1785 RepID=UPI003F9B3EB9
MDDLDDAALAAVGFTTLGKEIELALAEAGTAQPIALPAQQTMDHLESECDPQPVLPAATAAWSERQPALKRYATWLVYRCGLKQGDAAKVINASGHRTPQDRM